MKKNLLYVHNSDFRSLGANQVQVLNMCKAFQELEINTTLLSIGEDKQNLENNYGIEIDFETILLGIKNNYTLKTLKLFKKFLKIEENFEIIFTRDLLFAFLTKTLFSTKKVIYELHDFSHRGLWRILFKITYEIIDNVIVISEGLKEDLAEKGFDDESVVVLHDGVDLNRFNIDISKEKARKKLNLPQGKNIVVYTGTFQEWKGYKTLLESSREFGGDFLFVLVGAKKEEDFELERLYDNVKTVEFVKSEKIVLYLKAADVLVLSNLPTSNLSTRYTSPLKLFEYMAAKRPIVASDLPSIRNIVSEEEVLFFEAGKPKDLKKKIESVIENYEDKCIRNAYKKVRNYSWKNRCKRMADLF